MDLARVTITEVAREAGVSIATVSRFLNNPAAIKKDNYNKVEAAIKALNYQPFIFAQRLAGGKLNVFGLIIPGYEGIFYSFYALQIIRGVAAALNEKKIDLHLNVFWDKTDFRSSLVDGVIFADIIGNEEQVRKIFAQKKPVIVLNKKIEDLDISFVAIDNFKGAVDAVDFLVSHGHKKIAHLAGDLRVQCAKQRLEGYRAVLEKHDIDINEEYIKITNFSRRQAREKMEELFSLSVVPTAVFCCSDEAATEVLNFCEDKKIEVPQQLSVIGFDDNPNCIYGKNMLTTVRQPLLEMASTAVQILKDIVDNKLTKKKVVLEPELIIRDTVSFL